MMKTSILCWATVLLAIANTAEARKNWALLIAGSSGYGNYRHQADICHAYQILHKNGIPDEQIVVMMYDDIAHNENNPYPGNIINKPGGPNVYPGVLKDYTKHEVNAAVFLAVLQGDKSEVRRLTGKNGKVIESGPDDYVFVNYADHGGPGILGMPKPPYLKARPLNEAIIKMHEQKKFAKLVFYVEACESGSIFADILPDDINAFVTTASNSTESSYGCYCTNNRHTCLGDLYSVSWMENSDTADLHTETLKQQYELVRRRTNLSHVMEYGDERFTSLAVEQFLGNKTKSLRYAEKPREPTDLQGTVRTDMVGIHTLESMLKSSNPRYEGRKQEIRRDLRAQKWILAQTTQVFTDIAQQVYPNMEISLILDTRSNIKNWDCYDHTMDRLFELCPRIAPHVNNFVLRKMNVLVNLCNIQAEKQVMSAIESVVVTNPLCY